MNYARAVEMLEGYEGVVAHMYLDTKGLVTIAVGQLLATVEAALDLALYRLPAPLTAQAIEDEIEAEYEAIKALEAGREPSFYAAKARLCMKEEDIDALLVVRIKGFEKSLEEHFADWETFPEPAQLALLDMVYNLGEDGLFKDYPKLMAAAKAHNWAVCAAECHRNGPGPARNNDTKARFLSALELEGPGI